MNEREEERVIEALRALTGGLTVTDQDILSAGGRLRSELEPPPRRRRTTLLLAAAAAAVVAGVVAVQAIDRDEGSAPPATVPAPSTPSLPPAARALTAALQADPYALSNAEFTAGSPLTAQNMVGLWVLRPNSAASVGDGVNTAPMHVDGEGDWRIGHLLGPFGFGVSVLDGDSWDRRMDDRSRCAMNQGWAGYTAFQGKAAVATDGSLRVQLATAKDCTVLGSREVWDLLAEGTPVLSYLQAVSSEIEWAPSSATVEHGTYIAPGTGHVLVVNSDGSFRYYDNLTTPDLVANCSGGTLAGSLQAGETPAVAGYVFEHPAMRITDAGDGCASKVSAQAVWVQLHGAPTDRPYEEPRAR